MKRWVVSDIECSDKKIASDPAGNAEPWKVFMVRSSKNYSLF